jgi:hypothetical protein
MTFRKTSMTQKNFQNRVEGFLISAMGVQQKFARKQHLLPSIRRQGLAKLPGATRNCSLEVLIVPVSHRRLLY